MNDEKRLTTEQAIAMLPDGEEIHTFRGGGPCLIGADWPREDIIEAIRRYGCELTGPVATGMRHGMALKDGHGWLFIETKQVGSHDASPAEQAAPTQEADGPGKGGSHASSLTEAK